MWYNECPKFKKCILHIPWGWPYAKCFTQIISLQSFIHLCVSNTQQSARHKCYLDWIYFFLLPNLSKTIAWGLWTFPSVAKTTLSVTAPFFPTQFPTSLSFVSLCGFDMMATVFTRQTSQSNGEKSKAPSTWTRCFSVKIISSSDLYHDLNPYGVTESWKSWRVLLEDHEVNPVWG